MDRLARSDLIYVAWSLTPDDEGIIIVHHATDGGQVDTKRYDLSQDSTWESVPSCVCRILEEQDGERRGEWSA